MRKNGLKWLCCLMACLMLLPLAPRAHAQGAKLIALTFDDGPSRYTDKLLDALAGSGAHATFFVSGYRLSEFRPELERMAKEGHQLANHTQNHKNLTKLSAAALKSEVQQTLDQLREIAGDTVYALRPVGGAYNDRVCEAAGGPLFNWSVDTLDWKYRNTKSVYDRIMTARDGDIVLMHDLYKTTVDAACQAIPKLIEQGYELVTVNELFRRKGVTPENGTLYTSARSYETLPEAVSEAYPAVRRLDASAVDAEADAAGVYSATVSAGSLPVTVSTPYAGVTLTPGEDFAGSVTVRVRREADEVCVEIWKNGEKLEKAPCGVIVGLPGGSLGAGSVAMQVREDGTRTPVMRSAAVSASAMRVRVDGSARLTLAQDAAAPFRDTDGAWIADAAAFVSARGLLGGVSADMFGPYSGMTRGMLATVLWRMAGSPEPLTAAAFADVKASQYYAKAIAWACGQGIASGLGEDRFAPESPLTREQAVQLLYRTLGKPVRSEKTLPCADWAREAYAWGYETGVLTEESAAWQRPEGAISRAEAAVLLHRAVTESVWA